MALKRKLTKAEYDALPDALKKEYKAEGEDFILDVEGPDDVGELRRAKERESQRAKDAEAENKTLKDKVDAMSRVTGDVAALEISYKEKMAKEKKDFDKIISEKDKFIEQTLVDSVALKLATDLAGDGATVLLPHLKARLKMEHTQEGTPITRVLDKDGKPSALSVEDLGKEFAENTAFKNVVIATRSSGGGAAGNGNGNGNRSGAPNTGDKKFAELNQQERIDFYKRDPDGFNKAAAAHKQSHPRIAH